MHVMVYQPPQLPSVFRVFSLGMKDRVSAVVIYGIGFFLSEVEARAEENESDSGEMDHHVQAFSFFY